MEANTREIIEGKDFVKGGVYEVYDKNNDRSPSGIYFYPTSYPANMKYQHNMRGIFSKLTNKLSKPLTLLILYSHIYHSGIGNYIKFDKSNIYGRQPVSIIRSERSFEKINLSGLDLSYAKLKHSQLVRIDLSSAILSHADLTGANLTGSDLTGSYLSGAKLGKSILTDLISSGIEGSPDTLPKGYYLVDGCIIGPDTKISESLSNKYRQIKIGNGNNTKQYLVGPNVDLAGVDLSKIERFVLNNADLTGANLTGADLTGLHLTGAILTGAILTGANLTDAKLYNTILTGIKSGGIKGIPERLPKDYYLVDGIIIGPDIDIPNTIKKYRKIKIKNNKNMTKEYIIGPNIRLIRVNLTGIDLTDANLTGAKLNIVNLTDVNLTGADLTDADLTDSILTGIKSGGIKGNPILPKGYKIINGYIIGPNVNLYGADLTGADLTGADLTGIDLTDIDLTGANLTGIISGEIKGEPKLPKKYVLIDGFIIGPEVNLSNKNIHLRDLSYVNLSGANLSKVKIDRYCLLSFADLTGADLTGADLIGVDLTGANLKKAILTRTILFENSLSKKQKSEIIGEPDYEANKNIDKLSISISKRITDGKNKINNEKMTRAKLLIEKNPGIKNENKKKAIQNEYNKLMEKKRKQNEEDTKGSIRTVFLEKENREPTQNEINQIYENTISKDTKRNNKNFSDLLDYLLDKKNQGHILENTMFHIIGEQGINSGGLTISIFDKCNKIFIERYFKEYSFEEKNYQILKNLNKELFEEFKKACIFIIFLAKKVQKILYILHRIKEGAKILIQINPQLLELLQLGELKYYKKYVNLPNNSNNHLNSSSLTRIQNEINNNSNNLSNLKRIQIQQRYDINENKIIESDFFKQLLQNNSIFDYKHLNKVKEFYRLFWEANPDIFTNHIDYSWDNFEKRLNFQLPNSNIFISYDDFMVEENAQINTYPFIELILKYLKYSDEYRMRFTTVSCSSYTYSGPIYIKIINVSRILDPFNAHTCFQTIDVNIKLSDRYPVIYHKLFCEHRNQVVNNQNESRSGHGRVSEIENNRNGSGRVNNRSGRVNNGNGGVNNNESGRANNIENNGRGRGSVQNERGNPIVSNESGRANNIENNGRGNGNGRRSGQNERGNPIVSNESGRGNGRSCKYSIEKLDKLMRDAIIQGFTFA
jgi:uncharacterized protein YjbI with pentapeptide repeats